MAVLLLPFVLTRVLRPFEGQTWATVLLIVVVALVVLTWTLELLMNCVLLRTRERHLLNRLTRQATYGFLAFAGAALACAVYGAASGPSGLLTIAFGFGLWAMVTGSVHHRRPGQRKLMVIAAAAIVLFGGIVATWLVAFAR